MKVYTFGNQDLREDRAALDAAEYLKNSMSAMEFIFVKPNEDLPFVGEEFVVIMDVVQGLKTPTLFDESQIDSLVLAPRTSAHDFDLGFQLKYLKKLGKLGKVFLVGLPIYDSSSDVDYFSIQSIFKKLVAQDMQGS